MVLTTATLMKEGMALPDFRLQDPGTSEKVGREIIPASSKGVLVAIICNHCPYVVHIRSEMVRLAADYQKKNIFTIAVNANDCENYPEDSPQKMVIYKEKYGYGFPYLWDEKQEFVKQINAVCTPDFYLFDSDQRLIYHGQFDDSRPGTAIKVSGSSLRSAIDHLLARKKASSDEEAKPSVGCSIKWRVD